MLIIIKKMSMKKLILQDAKHDDNIDLDGVDQIR